MKRTIDMKATQVFGGMPIRLHLRNDLHLARKIWHCVMGLVIVFCYLSGLSRFQSVMILSFFLGLDLFVEMARLRSPVFNDRILRVCGVVMRSHEATQMSTIPHYITATIIAIAIFPKTVAVLSILYLACGDPIASLFGILYGQKGPRLAGGKTLIGTGAGVVACALVTWIYLSAVGLPPQQILGLSLIGGLAGGGAELLPFDVDDNFSIPVISGFVMWLAFMVMGV